MQAYRVILNGKEIDKVFYPDSAKETNESVKRSLVEHDGYDPSISVVKEYKTRMQRLIEAHPKSE